MSKVVIPRSQIAARGGDGEVISGAPLSVSHAVIGHMVPTQFFDKQGKPHTEMVFVVGDTVYRDPNGERWASELKVLSDTVADQIKSRVNDDFRSKVVKVLKELGVETSGTIKSLSDVDVLADDVDEQVSKTTA